MTVALLDINDCNLQLWGGTRLVQSPGYALLEGNEYRFGSDARGRARLQPRAINNRFWWQLNTEALQPSLGPARHTADLAHAHLQCIHREGGEPTELLLACPGSMQREQLSLLLGIAQQCPFQAVGLVHRSALLGSLHGGNGPLFHLELQLHQALVTQLQADGNEITVQRAVPLPGCGMLQVQEHLVTVVANAFIQQTRFDPRRKAATEQQLYDALPSALQSLAVQAETNIEINGYRARVSNTDMATAGTRLFTAAADAVQKEAAGAQVIVDPLPAMLPGLHTHFGNLQVSDGDALWQAAQRHGEALVNRETTLSFIATLPCLGGEQVTAITPEPVAEPEVIAPVSHPTHLLIGASAQALATHMDTAPGLSLEQDDRGWRLCDTAVVNGASCHAGTVLRTGDRIALGDTVALLIEVQP